MEKERMEEGRMEKERMEKEWRKKRKNEKRKKRKKERRKECIVFLPNIATLSKTSKTFLCVLAQQTPLS